MKEDEKILIKFANQYDLIGDFPHLIGSKICWSSAICLDDGDILLLNKKKLLDFIQRFPGFLILLKNSYLIN